MTHESSRSRRWLYLALGVFVVGAAVLIAGCASGSFFDRLVGSGGSAPRGAGDAVPQLWGGITHSLSSLGLWLSLAGGISILVGAYKLWPGPSFNPVAGGAGVGIGIGLILLNGLVQTLFPLVAPAVILGTVIIGGWVAYRLATGRGVGGHTLRCVVASLRGRAAHKNIHEHPAYAGTVHLDRLNDDGSPHGTT